MISPLLLAAAAIAAPAAATFDGMTQAQVETALDDPARRARAVALVMRHPAAVNPFAYAHVIGALWARGDRMQAAFWFYVFQIRSRAWSRADGDPSGYPAPRASLNQVLGEPINGWLGADLAAFEEVPRRAIAWEARMPLSADLPDGMAPPAWSALVARERAAYAAERAAFLPTLDRAAWEKRRRENGLPVGALTDAGAPLPADWR